MASHEVRKIVKKLPETEAERALMQLGMRPSGKWRKKLAKRWLDGEQRDLRAKVYRWLVRKYGERCWYCGIRAEQILKVKARSGSVAVGFSVDHILPRGKGGDGDIENLALVCTMCNRAKLDMVLDGYLLWLEYVKILASPMEK